MVGQHWTIDEDRTERLGGARPSEAEQARLSFSTTAGDVFEAWAVNAADLPAPDAGPGVHPRSTGSVTMSLTIDPGQALDATALVSGIESGLASAGLTKADDGWHVAQTTDPRVAAVAARYRSGLAVPVARPARIRKGDT
jgi:hypothetical protein